MYTRILVEYTPEGIQFVDITNYPESSEEILATFSSHQVEVEELYGEVIESRLSEINAINWALTLARAQIITRDYSFGRDFLCR